MNESKGRAEHIFSQLGKGIDSFFSSLSKKAEDFDLDTRIAELKKDKEKIRQEFENFQERSEPRIKEVQEDIEQSAQRLKTELENLIRKMR